MDDTNATTGGEGLLKHDQTHPLAQNKTKPEEAGAVTDSSDVQPSSASHAWAQISADTCLTPAPVHKGAGPLRENLPRIDFVQPDSKGQLLLNAITDTACRLHGETIFKLAKPNVEALFERMASVMAQLHEPERKNGFRQVKSETLPGANNQFTNIAQLSLTDRGADLPVIIGKPNREARLISPDNAALLELLANYLKSGLSSDKQIAPTLVAAAKVEGTDKKSPVKADEAEAKSGSSDKLSPAKPDKVAGNPDGAEKGSAIKPVEAAVKPHGTEKKLPVKADEAEAKTSGSDKPFLAKPDNAVEKRDVIDKKTELVLVPAAKVEDQATQPALTPGKKIDLTDAHPAMLSTTKVEPIATKAAVTDSGSANSFPVNQALHSPITGSPALAGPAQINPFQSAVQVSLRNEGIADLNTKKITFNTLTFEHLQTQGGNSIPLADAKVQPPADGVKPVPTETATRTASTPVISFGQLTVKEPGLQPNFEPQPVPTFAIASKIAQEKSGQPVLTAAASPDGTSGSILLTPATRLDGTSGQISLTPAVRPDNSGVQAVQAVQAPSLKLDGAPILVPAARLEPTGDPQLNAALKPGTISQAFPASAAVVDKATGQPSAVPFAKLEGTPLMVPATKLDQPPNPQLHAALKPGIQAGDARTTDTSGHAAPASQLTLTARDNIESLPPSVRPNPFQSALHLALKSEVLADPNAKKIQVEPLSIAQTPVPSTTALTATDPKALTTHLAGLEQTDNTALNRAFSPTISFSQLQVKEPEANPKAESKTDPQLLVQPVLAQPAPFKPVPPKPPLQSAEVAVSQPLLVPALRIETTIVTTTAPDNSNHRSNTQSPPTSETLTLARQNEKLQAIDNAPAAPIDQAGQAKANPFQAVAQLSLRNDGINDPSGKKILAEPIVITQAPSPPKIAAVNETITPAPAQVVTLAPVVAPAPGTAPTQVIAPAPVVAPAQVVAAAPADNTALTRLGAPVISLNQLTVHEPPAATPDPKLDPKGDSKAEPAAPLQLVQTPRLEPALPAQQNSELGTGKPLLVPGARVEAATNPPQAQHLIVTGLSLETPVAVPAETGKPLLVPGARVEVATNPPQSQHLIVTGLSLETPVAVPAETGKPLLVPGARVEVATNPPQTQHLIVTGLSLETPVTVPAETGKQRRTVPDSNQNSDPLLARQTNKLNSSEAAATQPESFSQPKANPFQAVAQLSLRNDGINDPSGKKILAEPIVITQAPSPPKIATVNEAVTPTPTAVFAPTQVVTPATVVAPAPGTAPTQVVAAAPADNTALTRLAAPVISLGQLTVHEPPAATPDPKLATKLNPKGESKAEQAAPFQLVQAPRLEPALPAQQNSEPTETGKPLLVPGARVEVANNQPPSQHLIVTGLSLETPVTVPAETGKQRRTMPDSNQNSDPLLARQTNKLNPGEAAATQPESFSQPKANPFQAVAQLSLRNDGINDPSGKKILPEPIVITQAPSPPKIAAVNEAVTPAPAQVVTPAAVVAPAPGSAPTQVIAPAPAVAPTQVIAAAPADNTALARLAAPVISLSQLTVHEPPAATPDPRLALKLDPKADSKAEPAAPLQLAQAPRLEPALPAQQNSEPETGKPLLVPGTRVEVATNPPQSQHLIVTGLNLETPVTVPAETGKPLLVPGARVEVATSQPQSQHLIVTGLSLETPVTVPAESGKQRRTVPDSNQNSDPLLARQTNKLNPVEAAATQPESFSQPKANPFQVAAQWSLKPDYVADIGNKKLSSETITIAQALPSDTRGQANSSQVWLAPSRQTESGDSAFSRSTVQVISANQILVKDPGTQNKIEAPFKPEPPAAQPILVTATRLETAPSLSNQRSELAIKTQDSNQEPVRLSARNDSTYKNDGASQNRNDENKNNTFQSARQIALRDDSDVGGKKAATDPLLTASGTAQIRQGGSGDTTTPPRVVALDQSDKNSLSRTASTISASELAVKDPAAAGKSDTAALQQAAGSTTRSETILVQALPASTAKLDWQSTQSASSVASKLDLQTAQPLPSTATKLDLQTSQSVSSVASKLDLPTTQPAVASAPRSDGQTAQPNSAGLVGVAGITTTGGLASPPGTTGRAEGQAHSQPVNAASQLSAIESTTGSKPAGELTAGKLLTSELTNTGSKTGVIDGKLAVIDTKLTATDSKQTAAETSTLGVTTKAVTSETAVGGKTPVIGPGTSVSGEANIVATTSPGTVTKLLPNSEIAAEVKQDGRSLTGDSKAPPKPRGKEEVPTATTTSTTQTTAASIKTGPGKSSGSGSGTSSGGNAGSAQPPATPVTTTQVNAAQIPGTTPGSGTNNAASQDPSTDPANAAVPTVNTAVNASTVNTGTANASTTTAITGNTTTTKSPDPDGKTNNADANAATSTATSKQPTDPFALQPLEIVDDSDNSTVSERKDAAALITGKNLLPGDSDGDLGEQNHKGKKEHQHLEPAKKTGSAKPEKDNKGQRPEDLAAELKEIERRRRAEQEKKKKPQPPTRRGPKNEPTYKPEKKRRCIILKGDTLESLAAQYLGDESLAALIYEINQGFWWETHHGGAIHLEFLAGTTIFLPTQEEVVLYKQKRACGQARPLTFVYLTAAHIRSLRQALKIGSEKENAPQAQAEQQQQLPTGDPRGTFIATGVMPTASKPDKPLLSTRLTRASRILIPNQSATLKQLEALSRVVDHMDGLSGGSTARIEVLANNEWLTVMEYVISDAPVLNVHSISGAVREIRLELPAAIVREMAMNDLNTNRLEYARRFLLGRKLLV